MTTPQTDVEALAREFRAYRRRSTMAQVALLAVAVMGFARPPQDMLRVRGLVVEDSLGRPRIVLGAPLALAGRTANESGVGVAVLSAAGELQAAMGAPTPAPRIGGKVATRVGDGGGAGFVIADASGNERGGMAAFPDGRANMCLDYAKGVKEAACLVVFPDDQYSGLVVNGTPSQKGYDRLAALISADGSALMKISAPSGEERAILTAQGDGPARLIVFDTAKKSYVDVMPKR